MVIQIFNQGFNEGIQRLQKAKKVFNRLWDAVLSRIVKWFQQDFTWGFARPWEGNQTDNIPTAKLPNTVGSLRDVLAGNVAVPFAFHFSVTT